MTIIKISCSVIENNMLVTWGFLHTRPRDNLSIIKPTVAYLIFFPATFVLDVVTFKGPPSQNQHAQEKTNKNKCICTLQVCIKQINKKMDGL